MSQYLTYLLFVACPVSMGLMMWWMMRMNHDQTKVSAPPDPRIAELESQVNDLKAEARSTEVRTGRV